VCSLILARRLASESMSLKSVMRVDAGSSRLLSAQAHEDFHAETAFDAVVLFLRSYGLAAMLTMDRDVRWVGSATRAAIFRSRAAPIPVLYWRPAQHPSAPSS
jgi:hypothetical protein